MKRMGQGVGDQEVLLRRSSMQVADFEGKKKEDQWKADKEI